MTKLISMSDQAHDALVAALDGYVAASCTRHSDDEHGDESNCEGWGPRALEYLDEALDAVITA